MDVDRLRYILIMSAVVIWCGMIFLAPTLAGLGYWESSKLLYALYAKVCHQISTRSFFLFQHPLAVCHRCTGIYMGFLAGALIYPIFNRLDKTSLPGRTFIILATSIPGLDIILNASGLWQNTTTSRALSGFVFGVVVPFYFIPGIVDLSSKVKREDVRNTAEQIF